MTPASGVFVVHALALLPLAQAPAVVSPPAEQPPIANARLATASAAGGLEAAVKGAMGKQAGPAWIGYSVSTRNPRRVPHLPRSYAPSKLGGSARDNKIPGDGQACCWNDEGRGCGLEGDRKGAPAASAGPVELEGPTHVAVLLRVEGGAVGKIRAFASDCPIDAGGLPLHWLTAVKPAESVALLLRHATDAEPARSRSTEPAVHALALHAGNEAQAALEKLAASAPSEPVRKSAVFWLAGTRGRPGYLAAVRAAREDPSEKVREHAVFALTESREPEAIPAIVAIAREDKAPHVRGQALFWLAQKAPRQTAADAIAAAIERDPETEVKKKAVFALTQLPNDAGVPLLVQVARSNRSPDVKKQAMFWLGQSRDPRATKFFEEVLSR